MISTQRISVGYTSRILVLLAVLVMCGVALAVGPGAFAGATPDIEHTTDRVGPSQFDTTEGDVLWEINENLSTNNGPTVVDGILVTTTGDRVSA